MKHYSAWGHIKFTAELQHSFINQKSLIYIRKSSFFTTITGNSATLFIYSPPPSSLASAKACFYQSPIPWQHESYSSDIFPTIALTLNPRPVEPTASAAYHSKKCPAEWLGAIYSFQWNYYLVFEQRHTRWRFPIP
jgi:hypothetical protein